MSELKITTIRLPTDIAILLTSVVKKRGENVSVFIRRLVIRELALLSYLDDDQKKALGVAVVVS
jgi:hypothetical protein